MGNCLGSAQRTAHQQPRSKANGAELPVKTGKQPVAGGSVATAAVSRDSAQLQHAAPVEHGNHSTANGDNSDTGSDTTNDTSKPGGLAAKATQFDTSAGHTNHGTPHDSVASSNNHGSDQLAASQAQQTAAELVAPAATATEGSAPTTATAGTHQLSTVALAGPEQRVDSGFGAAQQAAPLEVTRSDVLAKQAPGVYGGVKPSPFASSSAAFSESDDEGDSTVSGGDQLTPLPGRPSPGFGMQRASSHPLPMPEELASPFAVARTSWQPPRQPRRVMAERSRSAALPAMIPEIKPDKHDTPKELALLCDMRVDLSEVEGKIEFISKLVNTVFRVPTSFILFRDGRSYSQTSAGLENIASEAYQHLTKAVMQYGKTADVSVLSESEDQGDDSEMVKQLPGEPKFCAGAVLKTGLGAAIGALCILDDKPRAFDPANRSLLRNFAEMIGREVERQFMLHELESTEHKNKQQHEQLIADVEASRDASILVDFSNKKWPVLAANPGWCQITGLQRDLQVGRSFWDIFMSLGTAWDAAVEQNAESINAGQAFNVDVTRCHGSGKVLHTAVFRQAVTDATHNAKLLTVPAQPPRTAELPSNTQQLWIGTITKHKPQMVTTSSASKTRTTGSDGSGTNGSANGVSAEVLRALPFEDVKLGKLLGRGSFGSVYSGTWNGAAVAVKVIEHLSSEEAYKASNQALEAILGLKMVHPNIVRTFKFTTRERPAVASEISRLSGDGELCGSPFHDDSAQENLDLAALGTGSSHTPVSIGPSVMETWILLELCNRGSLQEAIDREAFRTPGNSRLPDVKLITSTLLEIASAMAYLHGLDILHSDLNGNNILLVNDPSLEGRAFATKVSDFGLSRVHTGSSAMATETYGTVTHMPPELLSDGRLSKGADVYAFGVLMWEVYMGQRPWAGMRHVQVIAQKMRGLATLDFPAEVPSEYKELAESCMQIQEKQRPSFAHIVDQLTSMKAQAYAGELVAPPLPQPSV